eukprot:219829-Prymnesium_polylepis.1
MYARPSTCDAARGPTGRAVRSSEVREDAADESPLERAKGFFVGGAWYRHDGENNLSRVADDLAIVDGALATPVHIALADGLLLAQLEQHLDQLQHTQHDEHPEEHPQCLDDAAPAPEGVERPKRGDEHGETREILREEAEEDVGRQRPQRCGPQQAEHQLRRRLKDKEADGDVRAALERPEAAAVPRGWPLRQRLVERLQRVPAAGSHCWERVRATAAAERRGV